MVNMKGIFSGIGKDRSLFRFLSAEKVKALQRPAGLRGNEFLGRGHADNERFQIYGRKVDYLEEIILHMDQDQKWRDEGQGEADGGQDACCPFPTPVVVRLFRGFGIFCGIE